MADPRDDGDAPDRLLPDGRWPVLLWGTGVAAVLFGLVSGSTVPWIRRFALLALLACAFVIAYLPSSRQVPRAGVPLGGAGYIPPRSRVVHAIHLAVTIGYNISIVLVVLALLVRIQALPRPFGDGVVKVFPTFIGIYLLLLAAAARSRLGEQGGARRTWYTRLHGVAIAILAVPLFAATLYVTAFGEYRPGGAAGLVEQDILVLVLVGALGASTQIFLSCGLPTFFDLAQSLGRLLSARKSDDDRGTPPVVYAAVIAVAAMLVIGFLLTQFNVLSALGGFKDERVALLLILFPIGVATFVLVSYLQIAAEARRGLYRRKMEKETRDAITLYATCGFLGLVFAVLLVANLVDALPDLGPLKADLDLSKDLILLTIVSTAGPIGVFLHRRNKRVDDLEDRLPDFLNDLAETRRAGLTLPAALQSCALSDYGALSVEVRKMANQVTWGIPFAEAMRQFAERVQTGLVQRTTYLILEAGKTGGSVAEVLKAAAKDAYEIKALEQERRVSMLTYMIVIYVVFFVFLSVIAVLQGMFIPQVLKANAAIAAASKDSGAGAGGIGVGGASLDAALIKFTFFMGAIVQSIGNGLVGGVLAEGRVSAGLRHVAIMAVAGWVIFRIVLSI